MAISNSGKAVLLMATAVLMLPVMDAVAKLVSATIPSTQVAWTRFAFQIVLMAPFVVPVLLKKGNKNIARTCQTPRPPIPANHKTPEPVQNTGSAVARARGAP